jgi:ribA/ribD-fused uncharacterized protein
MKNEEMRIYDPAKSAVFCKTKEDFGGFSNMCGGYPLVVNGICILTSEALYQVCRFPKYPEIQKIIIEQRSPISAKMKSKAHRKTSNRPNWEKYQVAVMRWCLRVKLLQHWDKFSALLLSTNDADIVEKSTKGDTFWGAIPDEQEFLRGYNVLGRLHMELRMSIKTGDDKMLENMTKLKPLPMKDFLLFGKQIREINKF